MWEGYDGNDWEIYLWNGSETVALTDNDVTDVRPEISGTLVVWEGWDGEDYEIFAVEIEAPAAVPGLSPVALLLIAALLGASGWRVKLKI